MTPRPEALKGLIETWLKEAARKDSFHATMGMGWKACAADLAALLDAAEPPVVARHWHMQEVARECSSQAEPPADAHDKQVAFALACGRKTNMTDRQAVIASAEQQLKRGFHITDVAAADVIRDLLALLRDQERPYQDAHGLVRNLLAREAIAALTPSGGELHEVAVSPDVYRRSAAQELADPPKFPTLKGGEHCSECESERACPVHEGGEAPPVEPPDAEDAIVKARLIVGGNTTLGWPSIRQLARAYIQLREAASRGPAQAQPSAETADLLTALKAAQQFLDPSVPRGPTVNGWLNTVELVDAALLSPSG